MENQLITDCDIINLSHISSNNKKEVNLGEDILSFEEINLQNLCKNPNIGIISDEEDIKISRCLVLEMLGIIPDIDEYVIFVNNKDNFYENYVNKECINKFKYNKIINLLKNLKEKEQKCENFTRTLIVLDNCIDFIFFDKEILEIFLNATHYNITLITLFTNSFSPKPEIRTNFDYIFSLMPKENKCFKINYEKYFGIFPTFEIFQNVFEEISTDNTFMIIENRGNGNFYDKIKWLKMSYMYNVSFLKKLDNVNKLIFLEEDLPITPTNSLNDNNSFEDTDLSFLENISSNKSLKISESNSDSDSDSLSSTSLTISEYSSDLFEKYLKHKSEDDLDIDEEYSDLDEILNDLSECNLKIAKSLKKLNKKRTTIYKNVLKCNNLIVNYL